MATQRLVNTNFWKDTYVIDLDPTQKLLFLYFLTNPRTNLAGVYEISIREVAFDTGIDKDMVEKIIGKFVNDDKMHYEKGWLILRNFVKHQRLNPSMKLGLDRLFNEIPEWLQERVKMYSFYYSQQRSDTQTPSSVGTDPPQSGAPNLIKSNLIKSNLIQSDAAEAAESQGSKKFDRNTKTQMTPKQKKSYATAVRRDEALSRKELTARQRKPSSYTTDQIGELFGGTN